MKTLFLITARGGSKGVLGKNIKELGGKPLLNYSIDLARVFAADKDICLSTDDLEIRKVAERHGLSVPFNRPSELATDNSSTYDVILHALKYYESLGVDYQRVVLLQPTSPFRLKVHVEAALNLYDASIDMVVSVCKPESNPYSTLYQTRQDGYIEKLFQNVEAGTRRQDIKDVYELNGAVYVYNALSLQWGPPANFKKVKMVEMGSINSVDIDTYLDWEWCEFLLNKSIVTLDYGS